MHKRHKNLILKAILPSSLNNLKNTLKDFCFFLSLHSLAIVLVKFNIRVIDIGRCFMEMWLTFYVFFSSFTFCLYAYEILFFFAFFCTFLIFSFLLWLCSDCHLIRSCEVWEDFSSYFFLTTRCRYWRMRIFNLNRITLNSYASIT